MNEQSIHKRFNRGIIKIVSLLALAFTLGMTLYGVNQMNQILKGQLDYVSKLAQTSLKSAVWDVNVETMDEILEAIFLDDNVVFIAVVSDGKNYSTKIKPGFKNQKFGFFKGSYRFVSTTSPIVFEELEIGKVQVVLSKAHLEKELIGQVLSIFFLALLLIVMIAWRSISISRRMIFQPLIELENSASAIANGDLDFNISCDSNDEIGSLGKSFDAMREALKKLIADLNTTNLDLEDRVVARTAELEIAWKQAEAGTKAKSQFLSMMSHEMRTPMNGIIGLTHLILQTELSAKQQDYLDKVEFSAQSLLRIINDVLDFSKIEAGKLEIDNINFNWEDIFNNLRDLISLKAESKGLEIFFSTSLNIPSLLVGDPGRIGQILLNLTNNAVKFTETGEILIKAEQAPDTVSDGQEMLLFTVKDTGIGLNDEQIKKLFQPFSQTASYTTRKYGGTGLGLIISKRLVEAMGGEIWVESEPDKGSSFFFTVPLTLQEKAKQKKLTLPENFRDLKVLVVDDSATSRTILQSILESFALKVTLATSGKEGIRLLETAPPDAPFKLVLMDWKMPEMDGIQASILIRRNHKIDRTPTIIMVTTYDRETVMRQADKIGLAGILIKPISASDLFDTIMTSFDQAITLKEDVDLPPIEENTALKKIKGAKILLVEDNVINQQVACEVLKQAGMTITVADNGRHAVQKVTQTYFDAVLMDLQMPEMDGYEATRIIRRDSRFKNLPIIAVTAHAMVEEREKCLQAGMNDHAAKPIDPQKLFATLAKWIKPNTRKIHKDPIVKIEEKTEPSEAAPLMNLPGIDIEEGLTRVNGNMTLYREILVMFYRQYINVSQEIKDALFRKDQELAQRLAHTVKGVAGNIGANELQKASSSLELVIKQEKLEEVQGPMDHFEDALSLILKSLETVVEDGKTDADGKTITIDNPAASL